jgi:isoleucyl-tRNA synthetase
MVKNNQEINWTPNEIKDGRFGKWVENARDWNISRNRYWGSAIPVWQNEDKTTELCIGSIQEMYEHNKEYGQIEEKTVDGALKYFYANTGEEVDIHKHFVDEIYLKCPKTGQKLKRVPEVLDCWFESGSMPYASKGYPFNETENFKFPADFIAEGLDQTRGWFYTLLILGTALFNKAPMKNVIVNGIILAEDGHKMSKSKQNYPDPKLVFDKYGADALRFYLMNSPVVEAQDFRFSEV